ncbi:MAG: hypothetical protein ACM3WP_05955 [Acidobacteriota bacterium]
MAAELAGAYGTGRALTSKGIIDAVARPQASDLDLSDHLVLVLAG